MIEPLTANLPCANVVLQGSFLNIREVVSVDWEQALANPETYIEDEEEGQDEEEVVFLPPGLLTQIAAKDVPLGTVIGLGSLHDGSIEIFWEGRLVHNYDGSF